MSKIHEVEAMMVSEASESEAHVVKEAFGFGFESMPAADMPAAAVPGDEMSPAFSDEEQGEPQGPRAWLQSQKASDFMPFLKHEFERISPAAAARGKSEIERALGQLKGLNGHTSRALRNDYDGEIDLKSVEPLRQQIEGMIDRLEDTLSAISDLAKKRKGMRRKRGSEDLCDDCGMPLWKQGESEPACLACDGMVKEAGTPHFNGLQYQCSAFERAMVGILINGTVSGGRNMEDLFDKMKKKYAITDRENLAIIQILADMGYPQFLDRAKVGETLDPTDEKNIGEWQAQYNA